MTETLKKIEDQAVAARPDAHLLDVNIDNFVKSRIAGLYTQYVADSSSQATPCCCTKLYLRLFTNGQKSVDAF